MRTRLSAVSVAAGLVLAGCQASSGSPASANPPSGPPVATAPVVRASGEPDTPVFTLTSNAFAAGQPIPIRHTCFGADRSPPLAWSGAPAGTGAYALVLDDLDAGGFVHWVVANLAGDVTGLVGGAEGADLHGAVQGRNSFGEVGYGGPFPPGGTHRYVFTLYALDGPLAVGEGVEVAELVTAMSGHVLDGTTLSGTYTR